jgi:acyl carrier protein
VIVSESMVLEEIRRVVARELDVAREIQPSDRLVDDLGLDSLTLTTLAVELEDRFQIILSDEEATRIQTVAELTRLVALRVGARS